MRPLRGIRQEDPLSPGRARGGNHSVSTSETVVPGDLAEMGLDVDKPDVTIGHEIVEVRHQLGLGQDWQLHERPVLESDMEAPIER